jgi:hypothetical protein
MRTQSKPAIRVAAAALALSACGIAVGICGGTPAAHASVVSARHAPGNSGFADLRDLAQVKRDAAGNAVKRARAQAQPSTSSFANLRDLAQVTRDAAGNAVERARAHPQSGTRSFAGPRDLAQAKRDAGWAAVQRARAAASPDGGLAACTALSDGQPGAASDYQKIAAQFTGSRWPDLRLSGLAYVEIASQLLATHAYGGETVWFYQRLSAACAKHGRPLDF